MMSSMRKRGLRHYIYLLQVFLGPSSSDVDIQFHNHIVLWYDENGIFYIVAAVFDSLRNGRQG